MTTITEEKIIETAERLAAEGKNPTQVTVRAALGGGSFATIGPVLKAWKDSQKEDHALAEIQVPDAITERLEQLQGAIWQAAVDEAERRLTAEREALKVAQEAAAAEVAEQLESVAMLETEAGQLRQAIEDLEADAEARLITFHNVSSELASVKEQAQTDKHNASEAIIKETSRADAAVERAERAETLHDKTQAQARADLADLRKEHKADIEMLKAEVKAIKAAAAEEVKKADIQTQEQALRADKAEKEAKRLAADESTFQGRLEAAQREAEQVIKRMEKLEAKADKAAQEAAELRGELKSLKSQRPEKK